MNVAYLLGSLNTGGTERLLLDIFHQAPYNNFNIIGIYRKGGQLEGEFLNTGQSFFKLSPKNRFDFSYLLRLRKLLKQQNIQIAHAQQSIDALMVRLSCIGIRIKVVVTIHGFDHGSRRLPSILRKFSLKWSDLSIFVSQSQQNYYKTKYPFIQLKKNAVIYNGILFNKFDDHLKSNLRKEFSIPEKAILLGSVGNFVAGRNQLFICQFLKLLKDKGTNFVFIFVGKRNELEPWRYDQCKEFCIVHGLSNVIFAGSRSDVPSILKQLDAFIYFSDHDTFGIAVIEAIAAGIPVFVNDWDVMLEVTNNGQLANIYHNHLELFELFSNFAKKKDYFKTKAFEASIIVRDIYSIEKHIHTLHSVYSEIL